MKKIIIFLFTLLSLNSMVNAQVNSQNPDMIIDTDVGYRLAYNRPIIRAASPTEIVSYHEEDKKGIFSLLDGGIVVNTLSLPDFHFVTDFEIDGGIVYFCGEYIVSSSSTIAILGSFSLADFYIQSPHIDFYRFNAKTHAYFKKMEMFFDPILMQNIITAIGHSYDKDLNGNRSNQSDFLAISDGSFLFFNYYDFLPTDEIYHDVIETDNYIVLSGEIANQGNTLAFRRIDKTNYNIPNINDIYTIILPHLEPLTYLLGEGLDGTDTFITSTYAEINNIFGTILRTYDASTMDEIQDQFIPSSLGEKTEPYELKYMNNDTVLLLQYSTSSPETKIYYIDPIPTPVNNNNFYVVNCEYYPNRDFYSLDKYSQNNYIAIGISAENISYAARYISSDNVSCAIIESVEATFYSKYGLNTQFMPISATNYTLNIISNKFSNNFMNLNTYCP